MSFTPQQQEALDALEWLNSTNAGDVGTGRTTVLAIAALRRAAQTPDWVDLEDHRKYGTDNIYRSDIYRKVNEVLLEHSCEAMFGRFQMRLLRTSPSLINYLWPKRKDETLPEDDSSGFAYILD